MSDDDVTLTVELHEAGKRLSDVYSILLRAKRAAERAHRGELIVRANHLMLLVDHVSRRVSWSIESLNYYLRTERAAIEVIGTEKLYPGTLHLQPSRDVKVYSGPIVTSRR